MTKQPKIVVFDANVLVSFFRSVALAIAHQATTRPRWQENVDDGYFRYLINALPSSHKPGSVQLDMAKTHELDNLVELKATRFLEEFVTKSSQGPQQAMHYLLQLEQLRATALESIRTLIAATHEINQEVVATLHGAINNMKRIRATSEIILCSAAVLTTGGAAIGASGVISGALLRGLLSAGRVTAGAIQAASGASVPLAVGSASALAVPAGQIGTAGFLYSLTKAVVESHTDVNGCDVVSVAGNIVNKVGTESIKQGLQTGAERASMMAEADRMAGGKNAKLVTKLQQRVVEMEKKMEAALKLKAGPERKQTLRKASKLVSSDQGMVRALQRTAGATTKNRLLSVGTHAAPFLGVLFAGSDFLNAKAEFESTFEE